MAIHMKCPVCSFSKSSVIDSRPVEENNSIRRRRECLSCHTRFTTYEIVDVLNPIVIKKDGSRELFDHNKLLGGIIKACKKRPVDPEAITDDIELAIQNEMKSEITTNHLGELIMAKLKHTDAVAYIRYVSVHREFSDIDSFMNELNSLRGQEYVAGHLKTDESTDE